MIALRLLSAELSDPEWALVTGSLADAVACAVRGADREARLDAMSDMPTRRPPPRSAR